MRILVTSFEPFGDDIENASSVAMHALVDAWPDPDVSLVGVTLPVVFDDASFRAAVARHAPDLVLALGEAGGRRAITPERWGVNEMTARIPDNAGARPMGAEIVAGGSGRRGSPIDVDPVVEAISTAGWAAEASEDAGRFVCNFIAYHAYGLDVPAIFIHVPAVRSSGSATVGAETSGTAGSGAIGREPRTTADIAEALAAGIRPIARRWR